jgi:hypothetical protein
MTTFTTQDLTPAQQEAVKQHEAMHAAHQVVNNRSINNLPNTIEEDEAMKELFEKMGQDLTGKVPVLNISDGGRTVHYQTAPNAPVPQPSEMGEPLPKSEVSPEALIEHMVAQFSTNLRLLLTTIISQPKAQPSTTPPEGDQPSLQETIALTLKQADWFKEMVYERAEELVDDKDFAYEIESAVETHFSNSFSLDDHVDIAAEVESKVEDIAEGLLKDIVQEQLEEVVAERLKSIRVVFD